MSEKYSSISPKVIKEMSSIQEKQYSVTVSKSNELIRKGCNGLTLVQQKILCYFIADIRDTDTTSTIKEYELSEIYDFLCLQGEKAKTAQNIADLDKKTWWIVTDTESIRYRFFNSLHITHDNKVKFSFNADLLPYLQNLIVNKNYTYYRILYILCMRSEYSIKLYEYMKAAENKGVWYSQLGHLKKLLNCEDKYPIVADFRKKVIDTALHEINESTDITVSYTFYRKPHTRQYEGIEFYIQTKTKRERLATERAIRDKLDPTVEKNSKNRTSDIKTP